LLVTFSTDDADATAAKAAELGGTVLIAPVDAPYSRLTVLRDRRELHSPPRRSCPRTRTSAARRLSVRGFAAAGVGLKAALEQPIQGFVMWQ
jgi:hypothetical protein